MRYLILIFVGRWCCRFSLGWVLSWKVPFCLMAVGAQEIKAGSLDGTK